MDITVDDSSVFVMINGNVFEYQRAGTQTTHDLYAELVTQLRQLSQDGGVFEHSLSNGATTLIRIVPGMFIQVIPGPTFKSFVDQQRRQQMLAQISPMAPIRGRG